jgi:hypothetical protein
MSPEPARHLRADDDAPAPGARLRALPDAPAQPRRRRRPAASWGDLDWSPSRAASPGDSDAEPSDPAPSGLAPNEPAPNDLTQSEAGLGERVDDPFAVEPLREPRHPAPDAPAGVGSTRSGSPRSEPPRRMRWEEPPAGRRTVQITGHPTPAPRRRSPTAAQISSRPDRVALWAVMLGLFLVLMAAATARAGWSHATLGDRVIGKGDRGSDVMTLQRVLAMKGYRVSVDGIFGRQTKRTVKRFQRHRGLRPDGRVGPFTTRGLAATWRARTATFFGPGLYGNRMACGATLRHTTHGVAHRNLGCGRRVAVYHAGRVMVLPIVDRGPFTNGVSFDVTARAARKLGMSTTTTIRAGY